MSEILGGFKRERCVDFVFEHFGIKAPSIEIGLNMGYLKRFFQPVTDPSLADAVGVIEKERFLGSILQSYALFDPKSSLDHIAAVIERDERECPTYVTQRAGYRGGIDKRISLEEAFKPYLEKKAPRMLVYLKLREK